MNERIKALIRPLAFLLILSLSFSLLAHQILWSFVPATFLISKPGFPSKDSYRFHFIGDFGYIENNVDSYPDLPLQIVSDCMKNCSDKNPVDMIFTGGDNFYPKLNSSLDKTAFIVFTQIFNWTLIKNIPFFLLYGNHDCYTSKLHGKNLEMTYRQAFMPDGPYNLTFPLGAHSIDMVFLSCDLFCLGPIDRHMEKQCKRIGSFNKKTPSEYTWLENHYESIQNSSVLWRLVFVHFPTFSQSTSSGDTEGQKLYLYPILHKYGIDAILSGHNHNMAHLIVNNTEKPVPYVKQDYNPECMNATHIQCGKNVRLCIDRNVSCGEGRSNCSQRVPFENFNPKTPFGKNLTFRKGEFLHQVIQGASGAVLDSFCDSKSPMANLTFSCSDYGFSELYIDESVFVIKYYHANSSEVLFETRIVV